MKLFIQVRDGEPHEHPVMEENMRQLFPEHDLETAPDGFAKFTRIEKPTSVYESFDTSYGHEGCGCAYEPDGDDGFKDVWKTIPMSAEEKAEKIAVTKQNSPYPSWIFVEETCTMNPPIDLPLDGKLYRWNEDTINWIEMTNGEENDNTKPEEV
jgi:hypothetical protein